MVVCDFYIPGRSPAGHRRRIHQTDEQGGDVLVDVLYQQALVHVLASGAPPCEFVLTFNDLPLKAHLPLMVYWPCLTPPSWLEGLSGQPVHDLSQRTYVYELRILPAEHLLEVISPDRSHGPAMIPALHRYRTSHVNRRILPLLLTTEFVGLPPDFPSDVWARCCEFLWFPDPAPGSDHSRHYTAWCKDQIVKLCPDVGPGCLFIMLGNHVHRCVPCRRDQRAQAARCRRDKRKTPSASTDSSTALVVYNPSPVSSGSPVTSSLMPTLDVAVQLIETTVHQTAAVVLERLESQRVSDLASHIHPTGGGLGIYVLALINRMTTDRKDLTYEACLLAFSAFPRNTYSAVNGRGANHTEEITSEDDEVINKREVVLALDSRFKELRLSVRPSGILASSIWCMSRKEFVPACRSRNISQAFINTEFHDYANPPTGGTLGCTASVLAMAASIVHRRQEYTLILENDCKITPEAGMTFIRTLTRLNATKGVGSHWDQVVLSGGGMSPCGGFPATDRVALAAKGRLPALHFAPFVAGTVATCLHYRGAVKLLTSGLNEELFCYDDFLNCVNANRHRTGHINPRLRDLPSVRRVLEQGGLQILTCVPNIFTGSYPSGKVSDTRYHVTKVGPLSVGCASRR
jgi:hypothetical protein